MLVRERRGGEQGRRRPGERAAVQARLGEGRDGGGEAGCVRRVHSGGRATQSTHRLPAPLSTRDDPTWLC